MAKPKLEKEVKRLECKVSRAEIEDRKNRLVVVDGSINDTIIVKREEAAEHNKLLRELRKEQTNLISAVTRGVELRDVECFWKQNDRLHKKELVRADNGQVVDETAQTLADKQEDLFEGKPKKEKGESDNGIVDDDAEKQIEGGKYPDKPTKVKGGRKPKAQPEA